VAWRADDPGSILSRDDPLYNWVHTPALVVRFGVDIRGYIKPSFILSLLCQVMEDMVHETCRQLLTRCPNEIHFYLKRQENTQHIVSMLYLFLYLFLVLF
jgi:hypothetical protein